jgi:hypothetical protein
MEGAGCGGIFNEMIQWRDKVGAANAKIRRMMPRTGGVYSGDIHTEP